MDDRRAKLRVRLAAAVMLVVCVAAVVIGVASVTLMRSYLSAQADARLRAYAAELISDSFVIGPVFGGPKPGPPASDGISVEIIDPGGHRLARSGAGTSGVPVTTAWIESHVGRLATVHDSGGHGTWRVIVESVHYSAHRIPYVYGAEDVSMVISARTLPGLPGVVVVGMDMSGVGQGTDELVIVDVAVTVVVLLLLAWAGARFVRRAERPAGPAPLLPDQLLPDPLYLDPRLGRALADAGEDLRRSLAVIRGFSDYYRSGRGLKSAELNRMVDRVAAEAERMEAATDALRQVAEEP
jgi:hypothetical protein